MVYESNMHLSVYGWDIFHLWFASSVYTAGRLVGLSHNRPMFTR